MDGWLKQSIAITLRIGPFLDSIDGNTQETALTIAQADVVLSKAGGLFAAKNDATSCTHDTKGYYSCPLNATDTGTLGLLKLAVHVAGALAVWHTFMVVTAQVWDSLFGADKLDVAVVEQANIDFGALQKTSLNAATPASVVGAVGSVTGNVGGNVVGSVASVTADVGITQAGADKVWGSVTRTLTAFAQSFSDQTWSTATRTLTALGSALVAEIWNALTSGMTTAGSIGKKLADWVIGTIDTYTGNTKQTGDNFARLGAPVGASISADLQVVDGNVDSILADTGTDGVVIPQAQADKVWGTATRTLTAFAQSFSDQVWSTATRTLTAFSTTLAQAVWDVLLANILIASSIGLKLKNWVLGSDNKNLLSTDAQTGVTIPTVTSVTSIAAGGINAAAFASGTLKVRKNTLLNNFMFMMVDSTDHVTPKTGLTITAQRSIDGAAFAACANVAVELSNGWYKINLAATDLNGDVIILLFTAANADATNIEILTEA